MSAVVLVALALFGEPIHFEGLLLAIPLCLLYELALIAIRFTHKKRTQEVDAATEDGGEPA